MNKDLVREFNEQINQEFYSAYLYLQISAFYGEKGLDGFAAWFLAQAREEEEHGVKLIRYLISCGKKAELRDIAAAQVSFDSLEGPLEAALAHETAVTARINTLYEFAFSYKDFQTADFLSWFVKEQGEEMETAASLVQKMQLYGRDGQGLYQLNKELGERR